MVKRVYIAATRQNEGKTTVCLGLMAAFRKKFKEVGFIKPVGQRYLIEQGYKVDEDSVLIDRIYDVGCVLQDMNPVAIERGFTEKYIRGVGKQQLIQQIRRSFSRCARGKDLVVIEGTGHAGVGSVFDLSNAAVARKLNAGVVLVTGGGIGRPIDEVMLNAALFEKMKVPIIGVIINKVKTQKYEKVANVVRKGFKRKGLELLGAIPYRRILSAPTVEQIIEETSVHLLFGRKKVNNLVNRVVVGAMEPHNALHYIKEGCLIITPGDREDIVLAAMSFHAVNKGEDGEISGIVLSGGLMPHPSILELLKKAEIPVLKTRSDTYSIASEIHDLLVKIRPEDTKKIRLVRKLVEKYVNIDRIIAKT